MNYVLKNLLIILATVTFVQAQNLVPPVTNFSKNVYKAGSQNWDISIADDGLVYVANNNGLLRYDGMRWELFPLPNKTIIRSVLYKDNKIYTGSYEEFGYWQKNKTGGLDYTSLSHLFKDINNNDEEIWQILPYGKDIAFRSFGKLYIFNGTAIEAFTPEFIITSVGLFNDYLTVGSDAGDIYKFDSKTFTKFDTSTKLLNEDIITDLIEVDSRLLIGTKQEGLFYRDKDTIRIWEDDDLNEFLRHNEINNVKVYDQKAVFGTIKNGILIYDFQSKDKVYLNRMNGLQNNTILAMEFKDNALFIGTDNGIDKVIVNSEIEYFKDLTGELGAVYAMITHKGNMYLGSNTGIHLWKDDELTFIPGSQGQVWSFSQIDESLYANHNSGILKVDGTEVHRISSRTGSYNIVKDKSSSNSYVSSTYNGIDFYKSIGDNLSLVNTSSTFTKSVDNIVFQGDQTLWASHPYKGFFKMSYLPDASDVSNINYYDILPQFQALKTKIHSIKGEITFNNSGEWYVYKPIADTIIPYKDLSDYRNHRLIGTFKNLFWFKHMEEGSVVITDFKTDSIHFKDAVINRRSIRSAESVYHLNDSIAYLTLSEGFAKINKNQLYEFDKNLMLSKPMLVSFNDSDSSRTVEYTKPIIIKNKASKNISIQVAAPLIEDPSFYYLLNGSTEGIINEGELNFQNLRAGDYNLKVFAVLNGKKSEEPLSINFTVSHPWYQSNLMMIIYILVICIALLGLYRYNSAKLQKHKRALEEKVFKEQEKKLQLDEQKRLRDEINKKRKELANSTFQAAERNRTLNEIKDELLSDKPQFINSYKLKKIESKINKITDGGENWKVFETNFNEINENFFRHLLEKYPKLSSKDLKLCAYLKLNLSSKEIAPLMSITVRGVEIHRYRLRKKLSLDSKTNLSKFLISDF